MTMLEAIPNPGQANLRRSIIPAFCRGASSDKLARRLFGMQHPTLQQMRDPTHEFLRVESKLEMLRPEPKKRQAGIGNISQVSNDSIHALALAIERLNTRMGKLESRAISIHSGTPKMKGTFSGNYGGYNNYQGGRETRSYGNGRFVNNGWSQPRRGDIQCWQCSQYGHIKAECPNGRPGQPAVVNEVRGEPGPRPAGPQAMMSQGKAMPQPPQQQQQSSIIPLPSIAQEEVLDPLNVGSPGSRNSIRR